MKSTKVYVYKNKINGKRYCGITSENTLERRYKKSGYKAHFKNALNKYGIENFERKVIMEFENREDAEEMEKLIIAVLNLQDERFGYNVADGGDGGNLISGYSEEQKRKHYEKISNSLKQRYEQNPELKPFGEKNGMYGKKKSEESKNKVSKTLKANYKNNPELKKKVARPGALNGRAKKVYVEHENGEIKEFDYREPALEYLRSIGIRSRLTEIGMYKFKELLKSGEWYQGIRIYR